MWGRDDEEAASATCLAACWLSSAQAYLNGTLAEYWEEQGTAVPVWSLDEPAWPTAPTARSTESVHHPSKPRRTGRSWRIARSYLAFEVLELTGGNLTLQELQSTILVPLELELAAHPEVNRWTPRRWVDAVDDAIRNQHSTLEL